MVCIVIIPFMFSALIREPAEKQPVGDPQTLFLPDASSIAPTRKQRRETAYKMADAILQETVGGDCFKMKF
ncbi:MAG TPA: hypothetical protein DIT87_04460 [Clostridiales bacterium]|nr:hypothetical protein [Clostridiales bacterium]HCP71273.1 hypothetical protein [Clostridiales bacterium]